jgi:hypothetical protein
MRVIFVDISSVATSPSPRFTCWRSPASRKWNPSDSFPAQVIRGRNLREPVSRIPRLQRSPGPGRQAGRRLCAKPGAISRSLGSAYRLRKCSWFGLSNHPEVGRHHLVWFRPSSGGPIIGAMSSGLTPGWCSKVAGQLGSGCSPSQLEADAGSDDHGVLLHVSNRQMVSGPSWASSGPSPGHLALGWLRDRTVAVDAQPWGEAAEVPPGSKPRGTLRAIRTASSPRPDLAGPHRASAGWRSSSTRSVTVHRWTTSSAQMPGPRPGRADGGALWGGAHGAAVPDKRPSRAPHARPLCAL